MNKSSYTKCSIDPKVYFFQQKRYTLACFLERKLKQVFLGKGVLNICSKVKGEHPWRSVILHGCSHVNLLHIFWMSFLKNTSGWLLLALYNLAKVIILHSLTSYRINVYTSFSFSKGHHEYRDIYLLKTMITALLDS